MPKRKIGQRGAEESFGERLAHLLPVLAKTLAVSTDQLLGVAPAKANGRGQDTRLRRRFRQIEKLPPAERKPIIQVLDAFLAKSRAE